MQTFTLWYHYLVFFGPYWLASTPFSLLGLVLLVRLMPAPSGSLSHALPESWSWPEELLLASCAGVWVTLTCLLVYSEYYLPGGGLISSDFEQYCALTGYAAEGTVSAHHYDRFRLASILPGGLAQAWGITDGLLGSSILSLWWLVVGLYLWARALMGRMAGLSACLVLCACAPLVSFTRTLTFYPQWSASFVLMAGLSCVAMRLGTPGSLLLASSAVGLSLLLDVRSILWALGPLALLGLVVLRGPRTRLPLRMGLLLVPLLLSFYASQRYNHAHTTPLELQVSSYVSDSERLTRAHVTRETPTALPPGQRGFVWGHSDLRQLYPALLKLVAFQEQVQTFTDRSKLVLQRQQRLTPWLSLLGVAGVLSGWGLRRQPWMLLALVLSAGGFLAAYWKTAQVYMHVRMLSLAYPVLPLLLGLAFSVAISAPLRRRPTNSPETPTLTDPRRMLRPLVGLLLLQLGIQGSLPTYLSPVAAWRTPLIEDSGFHDMMAVAAGRRAALRDEEQRCLAFLRRDQSREIPAPGRLVPSLMQLWEP